MCDDRELKCLKFVQNNIFCKDKQSIENSYIYKTYLNISNNELKKERDYLVNPEYNKPYFGLLERNREEFESILRVANRNRDTSCFPDFTFENGFIEHFQVTSSIENSKGSKHKRKENQFCRKVDTETKKQVLEWSETSRDAVLHSKSWKFQYPEHSYKFLCESFKRNWENHMESYGKYTGPQKIGIFMVEYSESALEMCENVYCDWINGMAQGDMRKQEKFNEYRLSRDKNLL
ncbi:MAG TPA: hypothetical protein IAB98_11660, partial [Candidatus Egerieimonas intestinavium]|nr:hypothetical protein [Candidatus Egerieimonas intestinavium]